MPRLSGQVIPYIPPDAPLAYRLSHEVYALDGLGDDGGDYMVAPGARLEVGSGGKLYETMGGILDGDVVRFLGGGSINTGRVVMAAAVAAAGWWLFLRKKGR